MDILHPKETFFFDQTPPYIYLKENAKEFNLTKKAPSGSRDL